jgi:dethiobiotin synthetase
LRGGVGRVRNLPLLGVIIGDWPAEPGLAEESNVTDLPRVTGAPLWGRIPMGAGRLDAAAFAELVPSWMEMS